METHFLDIPVRRQSTKGCVWGLSCKSTDINVKKMYCYTYRKELFRDLKYVVPMYAVRKMPRTIRLICENACVSYFEPGTAQNGNGCNVAVKKCVIESYTSIGRTKAELIFSTFQRFRHLFHREVLVNNTVGHLEQWVFVDLAHVR